MPAPASRSSSNKRPISCSRMAAASSPSSRRLASRWPGLDATTRAGRPGAPRPTDAPAVPSNVRASANVWQDAADPEIPATGRVVQAPDDPAQRRQEAVEQGDRPAKPVDDLVVEDGISSPGRIRGKQADPLRCAVDGSVVREAPDKLQ